MTVKQTIALIGTVRGGGESHVDILRKEYRLLRVTEDDNQSTYISNPILQDEIQSGVEIIDCAKEACWEADIIALFGPENIKRGLIQQVKEFATQKTVIAFNEIHDKAAFISNGHSTLQQLLPHSKVFWVAMDTLTKEAAIEGNEGAVPIVENITKLLGYYPVVLERNPKDN